MFCLSVLYPHQPGAHFDLDYYVGTHMPLVEDRLRPGGLVRTELQQGIARWASAVPAPCVMICHLYFNTLEELQQAFGAHSPELIADIRAYTNIQPQMQISRVLD